MWQLFWDTWGTIADGVSRIVKYVLFGLILLVVFFFFGLNAVFYFVAGIFSIGVIFLIVANIVIRIKRARDRAKEVPVPGLTPADQADIAEFQEAMNRQPSAQMGTLTPSKKAAPPHNLPEV